MAAQTATPVRAPVSVSALATWDSLIGVTVRFPRRVSPDSITRVQKVPDLFGSYEWRIILVAGKDVLLNAFIIPPTPDLMLQRYNSIADAYYAGYLRRCERAEITYNCTRLAAAAMRDVGGQMEITISDLRWLALISKAERPSLILVVKRGGEDLLYQEVPLQYAQWTGYQDAIRPRPGTGSQGSR